MKERRKKEKLLKATYSPLWVALGQYHQVSSHKKSPEYQVGGLLSAWQMGWLAARGATHCFWRVSKPYLNAYVRRDKLMKVSISPWCVILGYDLETLSLKITNMPDANLTLNLDNVVTVRQWEVSTASEVFQTLLGCIYQRAGAFEGICQSIIMVYIVPYLPRKTTKMPNYWGASSIL